MLTQTSARDRSGGALLVGFVALQVVYLFVDLVVIAPPAPDAPIVDLRATVAEHADTLRWYPSLTLASFCALFVPGVVLLRQRFADATLGRNLLVPAAVLIVVTVFLTVTTLGVLGLVPTAELPDSLLRALVHTNSYTAWVVGSFASALFLVAGSMAMRADDRWPSWLVRLGFATATLALMGSLWVVGGDTGGALFAVGAVARAMWLMWVAATGAWLLRSGTRSVVTSRPHSAGV